MILEVTLGTETNNRKVLFQVFDTNIAKKWADEIKKSYPIHESNRFTGWPSGLTSNDYIELINQTIDVINEYSPVIKHRAYIGMTEDNLNILHKYFEVYRGGVLNPNDFFMNAPDIVKDALEKFNIYIHALEKMNQRMFLSPTITCTFKGPRYDLEPEDYQYFTYNWKFGTVYINYCEVGKHLLELFIDNDEVVGENNIRPLQYYSSDFKIKFNTMTSIEEYNKFTDRLNEWLISNESRFSNMGITKDRYALGLIPVASITEDTDMHQLIDELKEYKQVYSVKILD